MVAHVLQLLLGLEGVLAVEVATAAVRVDDDEARAAELGLLGRARQRCIALGLGDVTDDDGAHLFSSWIARTTALTASGSAVRRPQP